MILSQTTTLGGFSSIHSFDIKTWTDQLRILQNLISCKQFHPNALSQQHKTIHRILQLPKAKDIQHFLGCHLSRKIKIQQKLHSFTVQLTDKVLHLPLRRTSLTVRRFRSIISPVRIPPVIQLLLRKQVSVLCPIFLFFLRQILPKLITWHKFQRSNSQLPPIRNFFFQSGKSSFLSYLRVFLHGISSHMDFIQKHFLIRNLTFQTLRKRFR